MTQQKHCTMKTNLCSLALVFSLLAASVNSLAQNMSKLQLLEKPKTSAVHAQSINNIDENNFALLRIVENNPTYNAYIVGDRKTLALELMLTDASDKMLWRKKMASYAISVSEDNSGIAVLCKEFNEGYVDPDVPAPFENVTVYDFSGNEKAKIPAPDIKETRYLQNGNLCLVNADKIEVYNTALEKLYSLPVSFDGYKFLNGFISGYSWNNQKDEYTFTLLDLYNGKIIQTLKDRSADYVNVIATSTQQSIYITTHGFPSGETYKWDLTVRNLTNLSAWYEIKSIDGNPFSAAFNGSSSVCFLMNVPEIKGDEMSKVVLGNWNVITGKVDYKEIGRLQVDYNTDGVMYDESHSRFMITINHTDYEMPTNK